MTHRAEAPASNDSAAQAATQSAGQSAFQAIAEIVRLLESDPATDWSAVDIEALRQHLIDMDNVVLRSTVVQENVAGGARYTVTGMGRTVESIRRLARNHAEMVGRESDVQVMVEEHPSGAIVTVTTRGADEARLVEKIRALGFAGLLTMGEHHPPHHVAIARGAGGNVHRHE